MNHASEVARAAWANQSAFALRRSATIRGLGSYNVPKIDVLVSATVRSQPPLAIDANWQVNNAVIRTLLGGTLPPGVNATGTTTINIVDSDHRLFVDNRRTQVDMRFAKILRFGRTRANVGFDLRYARGAIDGEPVPGYAEELGRDSTTETFVALKVHVDNWRWKRVPFYLRTGKRMPMRDTEIFIQFKDVPYSIFASRGATTRPNKLVIGRDGLSWQEATPKRRASSSQVTT